MAKLTKASVEVRLREYQDTRRAVANHALATVWARYRESVRWDHKSIPLYRELMRELVASVREMRS